MNQKWRTKLPSYDYRQMGQCASARLYIICPWILRRSTQIPTNTLLLSANFVFHDECVTSYYDIVCSMHVDVLITGHKVSTASGNVADSN